MPRLMYDSTNPYDIPRTALMVAGYTDGLYKWDDAGWAWHGAITKVRICAVSIDMSAHVADIESGALTAAQGAEFVKQKQALGQHPSLYFSTSRLSDVQAALSAAGVDPYHGWSWWEANWNGQNAPLGSSVAHQYANPALSGGHYDLSWVADYWEGVDPAPVPPAPAPAPLPTPPPAPADSSGPPLDQARAAWARLGDLLVNTFPGIVVRVEAAISNLNKLP